MNDKCRSLIFRNSDILRQKKISLRHIFPIVPHKGGTINGKTKFSILYDNIEYKFYESLINENNYILYNDYDKDNPIDCVIIIMSKIDDTEYYQAEIRFYKKIINYFFIKAFNIKNKKKTCFFYF